MGPHLWEDSFDRFVTRLHRSDDYRFRGNKLRAATYLDAGVDPRVEFSPYIFYMWFRKEKIKEGVVRRGIRFLPAHPQYDTHHLVQKPRPDIPYFARSVPVEPGPAADAASKAAYARFALAIMRDDSLLCRLADDHLLAGVLVDWWQQLRQWILSRDPHSDGLARYADDRCCILTNINNRVKAERSSIKPFRLRRLEARAAETRMRDSDAVSVS